MTGQWKQLRLFPPAQPLVDRLGIQFFRTAPEAPGIYRMLDRQGRLLYVGKAGNLRRRLSSYRRTGGQSRRITRLIHEVHVIHWELCDSEPAARRKENELLRTLRPRFNRAGTWPQSAWYIYSNPSGEDLHVGLTRDLALAQFGAFRTGVRYAFAALVRLLSFTLNESAPPASVCALPRAVIAEPGPRSWKIAGGARSPWLPLWHSYFRGESPELITHLLRCLPSASSLFDREYINLQFTMVCEFFEHGPSRARRMRAIRHGGGDLLNPHELDDLATEL